MPVEFTSVLSADGAPAKKKGAQTSFDAMAEAEQALKEWQIAQEKKKNPSGNITLPTWSTLKEARQQAAEKKKVTYQKLNSAKKLADVREQQWEKLNAIYERDKKSLEEMEPVRKELEKFKYLANDYQEKISRMEAFRTQHQLNPTYENSENFYAAMEEVTRWENDHKRDLEKYNRLYQEYDTVVKEYNRAAESLNRYGPAAQDAVKTYANLFDSYDWANQDGLSDAVKQDYAKLEKSREEAEKQALAEYKDQLLAQKNDLENQLRGSARNLLQGGDLFQNLKTQRDVQGEIDTVRRELQILEERESAEKAEQEARSDPQFKNNAKKGARIVDKYLKIIMNSGNLDSYEEYNAMTDEQKEIYSYYMYSDPEKANAYKQGISKEINQTLAAKRQNLMEQSIEENPTLAGLSTLITRPFTTGRITAEALASLGQDGSRIADPNTRGQAQLRAEESARQASLKQTDNPVLQTLGQAGYAIADMAPALVANAYLPGAGTAYMGLMGGSGGYADAASRGLTNRQALTFGATSAVVSTALEKIGLDKIGAAFAGGKKPATQLLRQIAGSFLAEGSEEAAENVAQTIYDEVISGTKSARNQAIQQYMSQGMNREEAEKRAWMDMGKDTLNAFIVGGLAGGAMSGAGGVANNLLPSTSQQLQDMGLTRAEAENLVNSQRPEREYSIKLGGYNPEVSVSTEGIQEQYGISNLNNKGEVINKISAALENSYLSTDTQSKPITNIDTGMQIEIRKSGINETFGNDKYYSSRSGEYKKAKIAIMPELAKLIKYGEVRAPEAGNYHNPNSKVRYAYLTAPATVDGVDYQVTMDIRRSPNGENRFYIHDLQIEEADGGSRAPITNGKGQLKGSTPSAVGTNITSGSENVNTEIKQVPNSMTEDGARVAPSTPASVGDFYTPSVASDPQNVNAESRAAIEKLSSDMGITTVFDDTLPQSVNGYYDTQTGEIHINPKADVNTVFSHELAHSLENTSAYQKLKSLVLNELGDEAETLRQQKTELYNRLGKELDVDSELVADYISQNLFTDADSIRRVAEADRGLATRIKNWITRMIAKVTGKSEKAFLTRAEELYSQALRESARVPDISQNTDMPDAQKLMVNASPSENMKEAGFYYIDENGNATRATNEQIANSNLSVPVSDSTQVNPDFPQNAESRAKTEKAENLSENAPRYATEKPDYNAAVDQYGRIPQGEKPRGREINVPQSTNGKDRVSRFTRTEMEAKATPDELIKDFEEGVMSGTFSYNPSKQRDKLEKQIKYIQDYGYQDALKQWEGAVKRGSVSEDDMILGQILYAEAAKAGDSSTALKLAAELAAEGTRLGQAVSSMRMLKKLTPEGKLYYARQSVENLKRDLKKTLGEKAPDIKINDGLAQKLMDAKTQEEIDKAATELYTDIANQMPNTWMDKWDAWRYLAMLGNPRTHIRNIVGNVLFGNKLISLRGLKNKTGALVESGVDRLNRLMGGNGIERTKSLTTRKVDRIFARGDFKNMKAVVQGGGKYNSVSGIKALKTNPFSGGVIGKTKLDKPLNALSKLNSAALEAEDVFFLRDAYVDSMAQYMKANNLEPENMTGPTLEKARTYAIREAQKATFRDASALASQLNKFASGGGRARKVVVSGLVPFAKTPANIVKRGIEYSPIGLLNGVKQAAFDVRKGNKTAAEAIDAIASGLTGTGVLALGAWLASQGLVIGGDDDNTKKRNFDEMTGAQSYALDLSPLGIPYTYTLDWAAPTALPLFVGVELWNAVQEYGEGTLDFPTVIEALTNITEPVFNLTMLDGINSAIQTASYDQATAVTSILTSAATDYFTQGVPTLLGQINRSFFDNTRRTSYIENNSPLPDFLSRAIQSAQMKIPGLSNQMNPYQDAFGRVEENGSWWENFFSPGYLEKKSTSPAESAIEALYNETGDASVLPSKPQKSITVNGETVYLTAQQYTQYVQERGQMSLDALNHLVESSLYKSMDDNTKVKAVQDVYKYADALAKANLSDYEPDNWVKDVEGLVDKGVSIADAISFRAKTSDASTAEKADVLLSMGLSPEDERAIYETFASDSRKEDIDTLLNAGVSMDQILQAQSMYSTIYGKDEKASLKASEFSRWLDEQNWDISQKKALKDSFLYFTMSPVESTNYDKLTEAGLSENTAYAIGSLFAELKPEDGKESVTNAQKYMAIAQSGFSDEEKLKAFSAIMEEGPYNKLKSSLELGGTMQAYAQIMSDISHLKPEKGKDSISDYQKYMAAAGSGFSEKERMAVLGTLMSDSQYSGLQRAVLAGADLETYTDLLHMTSNLEPAEGESSVSNNEKYLAVVNSNYTDSEKLAALYGMMDVNSYSELEKSLDAGIGMGDHFQFKIAYSKIESDKDENGESVSRGMGTKQSKVNAYINSLPLTNEQKDALYLSEYTASKLDQTPWHGGELYQGDVFSTGASKRNEVVEDFSKSRITQAYGNDGHSGTDISHTGPDPYPPIYNTEDGIVTWVQTGRGNAQGSTGNESYGNLVQVTFPDGRSAIYAHLSDVLVKEGDSVKAGQQIGNMGNTGNSYGNHLHFELHDANGNTMDSTAYLLGEASSSSGGKSGSGGSSGSSGSSKKKSAYSTGSFGQIDLSARRNVPRASSVSSSSRAKAISIPTVRNITKSALRGTSSKVSAPTVAGIESRVSREGGDVRFIKL